MVNRFGYTKTPISANERKPLDAPLPAEAARDRFGWFAVWDRDTALYVGWHATRSAAARDARNRNRRKAAV